MNKFYRLFHAEIDDLSDHELLNFLTMGGDSFDAAQLWIIEEIVLSRIYDTERSSEPNQLVAALLSVQTKAEANVSSAPDSRPSRHTAVSGTPGLHPKKSESSAHEGRSFYAKEIEALCALEDGWDNDDAASPNNFALAVAEVILLGAQKNGLPVSKVGPCLDGGVTLVFSKNGKTVVIECFNTKELTLALSRGAGQTEAFEFTTSTEVINKVIEIANDFLE